MSPLEQFDYHDAVDALARDFCSDMYHDPDPKLLDKYWVSTDARIEWERRAKRAIATIERAGFTIVPRLYLLAQVEGADEDSAKANTIYSAKANIDRLARERGEWETCAKMWEARYDELAERVDKARDDLKSLVGKRTKP